MADVAESTKANFTPVDADKIRGVTAAGVSGNVLWSVIKSTLLTYFYTIFPNQNGWMPVSDTWAYASANTLTVASGAQSKFSDYCAVKFDQHGVTKYFYGKATANTTLTVHGGSAYVVENTGTYPITNIYYSNGKTPIGFPQKFLLTFPTFTTSGTPFTNQPTGSFYFSVSGNSVLLSGIATCHATSGGTGIFYATFTANQMPTPPVYTNGFAMNLNTITNGMCYFENTSNRLSISGASGGALATNSENMLIKILAFI